MFQRNTMCFTGIDETIFCCKESFHLTAYLQAIRRVWFRSQHHRSEWLLITHVQIKLSCGWLANLVKRIRKWNIWAGRNHWREFSINFSVRIIKWSIWISEMHQKVQYPRRAQPFTSILHQFAVRIIKKGIKTGHIRIYECVNRT